ncbi:MAG: transporter [Bacteroidetes bacterium]|nr:transporter [Bacteroidota bacterium]
MNYKKQYSMIPQRNQILKYFLLVILLFNVIAIHSQNEETQDILSDRGSYSTSPFVLPSKVLQIESGFSFGKSKNENITVKSLLYNSILIRYGLSSNTEIRLQTGYERTNTGIGYQSLEEIGFNPLSIGLKLFISKEKGVLPAISFLGNLKLPYFGNKNFKPVNFAPAFFLLMENDLSERFSLNYNLGMEWDGKSADPIEFLAFSLGYSINDNLSYFIENYYLFSDNNGRDTFIDAGFAYQVGNNIQFDISGGINLINSKNNYMGNVGFLWRLPK